MANEDQSRPHSGNQSGEASAIPPEIRQRQVRRMLVIGVIVLVLSPVLAWVITEATGWEFGPALLVALLALTALGYLTLVSWSSFQSYRRARH